MFLYFQWVFCAVVTQIRCVGGPHKAQGLSMGAALLTPLKEFVFPVKLNQSQCWSVCSRLFSSPLRSIVSVSFWEIVNIIVSCHYINVIYIVGCFSVIDHEVKTMSLTVLIITTQI